jgi:biotin operon repressor
MLMAPLRTFSGEELSKRLKMSRQSLTKAIHELLSVSMIKHVAAGKNHYYMINDRHRLLPDVRKSLLKNQKPYEDELFSAIRKLGEVQAAFLSGVFTGHPELPVDILIIGKINLTKLDNFLMACKKMMNRDVNYSVMTPDEFRLRRDTFDRFIKDIFDYHHVVVVDKLAKKHK